MAKGDSSKFGGDTRDSGRNDIEASSESIASAGHPDHNEDSALGDAGRLEAEIADPPVKDEELKALIRSLAKKERSNLEELKKRNVYGVLDGVSTGNGLIASRVASEKISDIMSNMRMDQGAEFARARIESAFSQANSAIKDLAKRRPDLGQISTTADVVVPFDNGDGTFDVAYGHVGDSRIYVVDGETGKVSPMTLDDGFAKEELRKSEGGNADDETGITREEYDLVMRASGKKGADGMIVDFKHLDEEKAWRLNGLYTQRNYITRGLGVKEDVTTGVFKVKKGDRLLLTSDGIHDNLTEGQIEEVVRQGGGVKELARAAYDVAGSKKGRAKPDDITGTLIELGGKETHAASQETAGKPIAEQRQAWGEEVQRAGREIANLNRLLDVANRTEDAGKSMKNIGIGINIEDLQEIERFGGIKGLEKYRRDWQIYSLERRKALLQQEIGEQAMEQIKAAEDGFDRLKDMHLAAVIAEQKAQGKPQSPVRSSFEIARQVDAMIKRGEDPSALRERFSREMVAAKERLARMESSMPVAKELKITAAEYDRLLAERMREEKLKADAENAAEEEKIRQQLETPTAPPRTTPSAQQGPRKARVMPAVQIPSEQRREQPPFISRAEIDAELKKQQQKKEAPKKKGWFGKLFGGDDKKE